MIIRFHLAARVRNISLCVILQHNLTNVPLSIADQDGSLAHTDKSRLSAKFRAMVDDYNLPNQAVVETNVIIIYAMALLQQQVNVPKTFGDLTMNVLRQIVGLAKADNAVHVDFLADRYITISIKDCENMPKYQGIILLK